MGHLRCGHKPSLEEESFASSRSLNGCRFIALDRKASLTRQYSLSPSRARRVIGSKRPGGWSSCCIAGTLGKHFATSGLSHLTCEMSAISDFLSTSMWVGRHGGSRNPT